MATNTRRRTSSGTATCSTPQPSCNEPRISFPNSEPPKTEAPHRCEASFLLRVLPDEQENTSPLAFETTPTFPRSNLARFQFRLQSYQSREVCHAVWPEHHP